MESDERNEQVVAESADLLETHGYINEASHMRVLNELFTKHFLTQEEVSELARKERWEWKDCLAQALSLLSTKSAVVVQGACSVMEEHGYSTSAKDLQMVLEVYQEELVTKGDLEMMKSGGDSLPDRLVSVQCIKPQEQGDKTAAVLVKYGHNESAKKLKVLNALFTGHFLTTEQCSKVARSQGWIELLVPALLTQLTVGPGLIVKKLDVVPAKESNVKSDNQPTTARTQENKDAYVPVSAVGECKYKDNGGADGTQQGKNSKAEFEATQDQSTDLYDLLDPVDMLAQIPENFYASMTESKWSIRKEALESILPLASKPKLAPGDYTELIKTLTKTITKDSNVLVVALAANVVKGLAVGLKEGFQPLVPHVFPGMLIKFKEKKLGVVTALREAVDAVYLTTSFSNVEENILAALGDKNPSVKAETALFLARCFKQCTPALMPKPLLNTLCPPLIQCLHDVPAVREAAAEALGTALKVVGEGRMAAYLDELESLKMSKVTAFKDQVKLLPPQGIHAKGAGKEVVPVQTLTKSKEEKKEEKGEDGLAESPPKPKKKKKQTPKKENDNSPWPVHEHEREEEPAPQSAVGGHKDEDTMDIVRGGHNVGATQDQSIDLYDLLDPVDMLAQIPENFYANMTESKWSIRKEALECILHLASKPKLAQGDYTELIKTLIKTITKDSNVLVVALAANVVKGLAVGLREGFQPLVPHVLPGMLIKFKEKKLGVVTALREAVDAVYLTTSFSSMEENILAALGDKNPSVKAETALFLARCFKQCTPALMPKPLLNTLCPPLIQCLHDVPAVREAAAEALGTALKVVGEGRMAAYLDELESLKMSKVTEFKDKVELQPPQGIHVKSSMKAEKTVVTAQAQNKTKEEEEQGKGDDDLAKPPPKPKKKKKTDKPSKEESTTASGAVTDSQSVSKPPAKKSGGGGARSSCKSSGSGGKEKRKTKRGGAGMGEAPDPPESAIADEEVEELAAALLPGPVRVGLASSKWQERLEAHEEMKKMLESMSAEEIRSLVFVKILGMKPGWKETMFQVMKAKIAIVAVVAGRAKVFGRKTVATVLPTIVDKLGDAKIKAQSSVTLMVVAERMTLNYISLQTLKHAFGQKNPKVQSESLEWLGQAVREFGLLIDMKPHVEYINKSLDANNPAVRVAAISLLGVMRMYVGAQLRVLFEDAKPALLQQIDAVFEKVSDESPPIPVRGPNCNMEEEETEEEGTDREEEATGGEEEGGAKGGAGDKAGGGAESNEPQISVADLIPKVDIRPQITSSLVTDLGDKNWKVRGEALQKVAEILAAAKFIKPSLGDLPGALKGRLVDTNKKLIITTLGILTSLAIGVGPSCARHARTLLPGVFRTLTDPQLQEAAITTLNAWYDQIGLAPLVEAEILSTALATENPNLRSELLHWLTEKLPEAGKLPSEFSSFVPPLFSCLEDRSANVRKHSQTVLPLVMVRAGYEAMKRQANKLKPASQKVVLELLEKHKVSLPAPAKSASTAKGKADTKNHSKPPNKTAKAGKVVAKTVAKKGASMKVKQAEDSGPPLVKGPTMQQRQKDERNHKVIRWSISAPRAELVKQLKSQMQPCVSQAFLTQLFHSNFNHHIAALNTLTECVHDGAKYGEEVISCVDLLLKWATLRFCDNNTTVTLKCLEFLSSLFAFLIEEDCVMSDFEAAAFLPFLVIMSGDAKDAVRKEVWALFAQICCLYEPPRLFGYVADGLNSKKVKQRRECLEMLGALVQDSGLVVCQPSPQKAVEQIAPYIGEKDSSVRNAALNTLVIFHESMGDAMYKLVRKLPPKDLSMLEERIRRSAKKPPETKTAMTLRKKQSSPSHKEHGESKKHGTDLPPQQRGGAKGVAVEPRVAVDLDATFTKEHSPIPLTPAAEEPEPEVAPPPGISSPEDPARFVPDGPLMIDFTKYCYPAAPVLILDELPADCEEILEDFEIPQYETSKLLANPPPSLTFSPSRMATTSAAISFIVSQIASSDQKACTSALRQMNQILSKAEHTAAVKVHVNQLLRAILMQMRMNFNTRLQQAKSPESLEQVMFVGKCLTSCLLYTFNQPDLAAAASQDTLVETEREVMTLLLKEKMLRLEEVAQLNRSFNVLMWKVIEHAEKNVLFGSLLHVMLESLGQDGSPSKLTELVTKCIRKLTQQLSQFLPQVNVDQLLLNVHCFFTRYNSLTTGRQVLDETPFSTVMTILSHLVAVMGESVLDHLTMVEESRQTAMYKYLCRTIAKRRLSGEGIAPLMKTPPKEGFKEAVSRVQLKQPPKLVLVDIPNELATPLADTLDKMRDRSLEMQREGFRELYDLTEKHPSFDLHVFIASNTLPFYQNWVKRGLKAVGYERECKAQNKKPRAEMFQFMLYSDELKASIRKYKKERKQLEMSGVVLTQNNSIRENASKDNHSIATGAQEIKKIFKSTLGSEKSMAVPHHSHPHPKSTSGDHEGQDNLESLMQRLINAKGTL